MAWNMYPQQHLMKNVGYGLEHVHPFCETKEINWISTITFDNWISNNKTDVDKQYKNMHRFAPTQQHH